MNNYYDIAEDDIVEALDRYAAGKYKRCVIWCHHAVENYLKHILVDKLGITGEGDTQRDREDAAIVSSRNLKRIYDRISEEIKTLRIPMSILFSLTNYYTKARYPGEGYVDIDRETADELIEEVKFLKSAVDRYLASTTR